MASKLYVGGLSYSTTSEGVREYFAQCGTVESAAVVTDRFSGSSRGFGFVEMKDEDDGSRGCSCAGRGSSGRDGEDRQEQGRQYPEKERPHGGSSLAERALRSRLWDGLLHRDEERRNLERFTGRYQGRRRGGSPKDSGLFAGGPFLPGRLPLLR